MNQRLIEGLKTVMFGLVVCGALLYMLFFATAGSIQVAVLLGTIAMLLWFGTAHPARLVKADGRPHWKLFMLATIGLALLVSAMVALSSGTMIITLAVGVAAIAVGVVRAIRHGLRGEV